MMFIFAASAMAGTDPSAFLYSGVGARALGMGGAFTSVADDTSAIYWNPAGLGKVNQLTLAGMSQSAGQSQWDTKDITPTYQFVGVTVPLPFLNLFISNSTVGVGVISAGLNNIPLTSLGSDGIISRGTMQDTENAYYLSYGCALSKADRIYAGATAKMISQTLSDVEGGTASGYDFDFGVLYGLTENASVGLTLDKGETLTWGNGHIDTGPQSTRLGLSDKFHLFGPLTLLGAMDVVQRKDQPIFGNIGTEFGYQPDNDGGRFALNGLFIRAGVDSVCLENRYGYQGYFNSALNFTYGMGLNVSLFGTKMQIDYAAGSDSLGGTSRVSLNLYF